MWAEDVTVIHGAFAKTSVEPGWTSTGTGTGTTGCVIVGKDESITSPILNLSLYSKITITVKARRYGTLTDSKAIIQAYISETVKGTTEATSTSVTNRTAIELTPTDEMTAVQVVFTCTNATKAGGASGGNGAGIGEVTIKGTPKTTSGIIKPSANYSTLTSAVGLDFTGLDLKAYIATEVAGEKVNMTQVNKVPAGTGLVLVGTAGTSYTVPIITSGFDSMSGNQMAGSASEVTAVAENGGYILKSGIFQPATKGNLPAGKAYLAIAASAHALNLDFGNGEVTSISAITNEIQNDGLYFNLAGQRVIRPTKGLYIVNGKKVVIK